MNTTIKDVARRANVSVATVSRVLNLADNVIPETRQRVIEAIQELGYTPNTIARSLKIKSTKTIGVIMTDLSVAFFANFIKTLENALLDYGYAILLANMYDDPLIEQRLIQTMADRRVDALAISTTGRNEKMLLDLQKMGLPVLIYDRRSRQYDFPSFYVDKRKAMGLLLDYLYSLGHRQIGFVTGEREISTNYDRFIGIQDYIYDKGLDPGSVQCMFGSFTPEFGMEAIEAMYKSPTPPTAIIACSVAIAEGIMIYCKNHGISIPERLSLATFGNLPNPQLISPTLTYIDDMSVRIARKMVTYLHGILDDTTQKQAGSKDVILEPSLIVGQSCAPPPKRSPY